MSDEWSQRRPTAEAIERVQWHAGLDFGKSTLRGVSISACTAPYGDVGQLGEALSDLMGLLQILNLDLNGPVPSAGGRAESIPRVLAYAITEIVWKLQELQGSDAALRVELAWNALLAGDIDDLGEHIEDSIRMLP